MAGTPTGRVLITGATGNVGAAVIERLRGGAVPFVAAVRDVARARARLGDEGAYVPFDFERPDTHAAAFAGIERLFLVRPPELADVRRAIAPAIRAARAAGVRHVVFLSLLGAERNRVVPHHRIERLLRESGMDWTFLRASYFMQNLDTTHREEIRRGELLIPAGHGATSFVDVRDVAAVGALALTEAGHANRAYDLTGARALTYAEVARQFTAVLGRPVRYADPSPLAYVRGRRAAGQPWPFVAVTLGIYTVARLGLAARVAADVPRLLGRAPLTLRRYIEDYRDAWR